MPICKNVRFNFAAPCELAVRMDENITSLSEYRTGFMRDRDRVLYSNAFRRLSGKTQVYLTGKDDHKRNRLTHTLEVSQIARTISQALGLDCDLTEAIALAHDIGHTPFGHAGEEILHEIMVPNSPIHIKESPMNDQKLFSSEESQFSLFGFKHNIQSLRIAASLETTYGQYGLNLTNYTLWGILNHSSLKYKTKHVNTSVLAPNYLEKYNSYIALPNGKEAWSFEAFVVAEADEIAQWHHDLEDALRGNAMTCKEVCDTIQRKLDSILAKEDILRLQNLSEITRIDIDKQYISDMASIVVNTLVNRLIECSVYNLNFLWDKYVGDPAKKIEFFENNFENGNNNDKLNKAEIRNAICFRKYGETDKNISFQSVISEKIHHSQEIERMNAKGKYIIKKLFQAYYNNPQQLPDNVIMQYMLDVGQYSQKTIQENRISIGYVRMKFDDYISGKKFDLESKILLMRKICDHISGMTDHYAIEEYEKLYG